MRVSRIAIMVLSAHTACPSPCAAQAPPAAGSIELLVRADDMGVAQSINEACLESFQQGIARSVEVIVPGPLVSRCRAAPQGSARRRRRGALVPHERMLCAHD